MVGTKLRILEEGKVNGKQRHGKVYFNYNEMKKLTFNNQIILWCQLNAVQLEV